MKNVLLILSAVSAMAVSGGVAASDSMAGDAVYNRLAISGPGNQAPETLVLYSGKTVSEMCYEIRRQKLVDGMRVSEQVERGTWDASGIAFDGTDTLYILNPDEGGSERYALRNGGDSLYFLAR
mgnify:CR=1 FL=1